MEFIVNNSTELDNALASATGGDTITLAAGDYGSLNLTGQYTSDLTIRAAEPGTANFTQIEFTNAQNITVDGVHVEGETNGGIAAALVRVGDGSEGITFSNSEVNGPVDNVYDGYYGIHVRDSSDVTIIGNDVHDVRNGIVVSDSSDVNVLDNHFDYLGNDGMKFSSVTDVLIEGNIGGGTVFQEPGAHVDFIQFQGGNSSGITIRENIYIGSNASNVQGIFMDDAVFDDVLIERNLIYTGQIRGITVSEGSNIVVRDNTILNIPGAGKATLIFVPDGATSEGNIVSNNVVTHGLVDGNLYVQNDEPNDDFYVNDIFVGAAGGLGTTLEDLQTIAGGPADTYGAVGLVQDVIEGTDTPDPDPIAVVDVSGQDALEVAFAAATGDEIINVESVGEGYVINLGDLPVAGQIVTAIPDDQPDNTVQVVFGGSAGHDIIVGADAEDTIIGGAGIDRLTGGDGADDFVFAQGTVLDIVYDFTDGEDQIMLDGITFDDVTITTYRGGDTLIQAGDDRMILRNVDAEDLTIVDFILDSDLG